MKVSTQRLPNEAKRVRSVMLLAHSSLDRYVLTRALGRCASVELSGGLTVQQRIRIVVFQPLDTRALHRSHNGQVSYISTYQRQVVT